MALEGLRRRQAQPPDWENGAISKNLLMLNNRTGPGFRDFPFKFPCLEPAPWGRKQNNNFRDFRVIFAFSAENPFRKPFFIFY